VSLQVFDDLEQGTDEWLAARCGIVTASVVGQLITPKTVKPAANDYSRALTASLVAERITGYVEPTFPSRDMERGTLSEPIARDIYAEHYKVTVDQVGFMVREESDWKLGYSPDGLVGDDGLIEIKAPRQKTHLATILADEVPLEYMAQVQAGLFVSGRKWADFISYNGGMPLYVKRVLPDERWQKAIVEAVTAFEANAEQMIATYAAATEGMPATERIDFFPEMEIF
jgi:putative phage-type endonuclease